MTVVQKMNLWYGFKRTNHLGEGTFEERDFICAMFPIVNWES